MHQALVAARDYNGRRVLEANGWKVLCVWVTCLLICYSRKHIWYTSSHAYYALSKNFFWLCTTSSCTMFFGYIILCKVHRFQNCKKTPFLRIMAMIFRHFDSSYRMRTLRWYALGIGGGWKQCACACWCILISSNHVRGSSPKWWGANQMIRLFGSNILDSCIDMLAIYCDW